MKQLSFRRPLFFFCSLILAGSLTFNLLSITETFQRIRPLRAVIGLESREAYLNRLIPTFSMYATVNQCLPPGSRVYLLYMRGFSYLCDRECYVDSLFEAHTLQKILQSHGSPPQIRHRLSQSGFTHLLYNEQILLGPESPLSPVEIARFLAFRSHSLTLLTQQGPYRLERLD